MIRFDSMQEAQDTRDLVTYVFDCMFEDFCLFITENGCAALSEEELDDFEDMDRMVHEEGTADEVVLAEFEQLVHKAALSPDTRHVYALGYRLYESLQDERVQETIATENPDTPSDPLDPGFAGDFLR